MSASLAEWLATWAATPGHAEQHAALLAEAGDSQREWFRQAWAQLTPEEREQYGITDEMVQTGELPGD